MRRSTCLTTVRPTHRANRCGMNMAAPHGFNRIGKGVNKILQRLGGFVILAFLLLPVPRAHAATSYYVSGTSGNDSWSGRLPAPNPTHSDGPFQTLAKAQSAMRKNSTIKTATLRAGTYSIAGDGFALTSADDGETWIPYAGEKVILDGGGTGSIRAQNVTKLTLEGITFQNMAGGSGRSGALLIGRGSGITIRWNTFLGCRGYCILGHNLESSLIDSNAFNGQSPANVFRKIPYKVISLACGNNNTVSHNLIENAQGGGIAITADTSCFSSMSNNIMDRNILKNVNTDDFDMGALYAWDSQGETSGLRITNNVIRGQGTNNIRGIYLDQAITGAIVTGNICSGCGNYGVVINGGGNNTVENNIFDLSSLATLSEPKQGLGMYFNQGVTSLHMSGNLFSNNIIYSATRFSNKFWEQCCAVNGPQDRLNVHTNLYCSANGSAVPNGGPISDQDVKRCCPGFADPANHNYAIPSDSCVYSQIKWQALATDQGPLPNPFLSTQIPPP
jgi:parallel beta-helix repeat protein